MFNLVQLDRRLTGLPEGVHLNPLQELFVPHMGHRNNVLICARTSSGKSTAVPMFSAQELDAGRSVLYVGSFKALVEEKIDDWNSQGHPWEHLPKSALSGDYTYDDAKIEEIHRAVIRTITPESLGSVIRNKKTARAGWTKGIGILVVDEGHLVCEEDRGAMMEAAIIELCTENPDMRLVVMSGTIPNHEAFVTWMSNLNGKPTELITSDYRPVEQTWHFIEYESGSSKRTEEQRKQMVAALVTSEERRQQQFLVGVFKKTFGADLTQAIKACGVPCEFHNADIRNGIERKQIEGRFKRKNTRVLVATSTLFTGVNLPARNVIGTAVEAGGKDVPAHTLHQLAGRAGRPQYDDAADVFFFIPNKPGDRAVANRHINRIKNGEPILSQMSDRYVLATHFLGALYLGRLSNQFELESWYSMTLAYVQEHMEDEESAEMLESMVEDMIKRGMVKIAKDGTFELRSRGRIAAQLLLDPYFFSELLRNFNLYFALKDPSDVDTAKALGCVRQFASRFAPTIEEMKYIPDPIRKATHIKPEYKKACAAIYSALQGRQERDMPGPLAGVLWLVKQDLGRIQVALTRAAVESEMWKEEVPSRGGPIQLSGDERIRLICQRVRRSQDWAAARNSLGGLMKGEMAKLSSVGLYDLDDVRKNRDLARQVLKESRLRELRIA